MNFNFFEIYKLLEEEQIEFFSTHPEMINYASKKIKIKLFESNRLLGITPNQILFQSLEVTAYKREFIDRYMSIKEKFEMFDSYPMSFYYYFWPGYKFGSNQIDVLLEKSIFIKDEEKRKEYIELCKTLSSESFFNHKYFAESNGYLMSKLLLNDKVINNNSIELLQKYSITFDRDLLIKILCNAFGEHVREIFANKPNMDILNLDNLNYFDKVLIDNFGIGFVNYLFSYNFFEYDKIISDIVKYPKKMENFKILYWLYFSSSNIKDSSVLINVLILFEKHEYFFNDIDLSQLNELQLKNLSYLLKEEPLLWTHFKNADDLSDYWNIRREFYINYFNYYDEVRNYDKIKEIIKGYLLGSITDKSNKYLDRLDVKNIVKVYNLKRVLRSEKILKDLNLSEDEIGVLSLLVMIDDFKFSLESHGKTIMDTLITYEYLNPVNFGNLLNKIRIYFTNKLKKEITSSEDIDKMKSSEIEGISVVMYDGEEFNLLVSLTEINLGVNKYERVLQNGSELLHSWLSMENGSSTISTTIVSSDINTVPPMAEVYTENAIFVFDSNVNILAYGGSDIGASHSIKQAAHSFDFVDIDFLCFSDMEQLKANEAMSLEYNSWCNSHKFPSEVTILRQEENIQAISSNPKKVMPIGMYVTGEITRRILDIAKVFNEYYRKHNLGEFKIIKINLEKYDKRNKMSSTNIEMYSTFSNGDYVQSQAEWYLEICSRINRHL